MEVLVKAVEDMTPVEYRACYLANYGRDGYMREMLSDARNRRSDKIGVVVMLWDGDVNKTTSLRAWTLLTPVDIKDPLGATTYTKKKSKYSAQFWVKKQHRRNGLAKTLMAEVKKLDPSPHVMPHDNASSKFFSQYDLTITRYDRWWIDKTAQKIA